MAADSIELECNGNSQVTFAQLEDVQPHTSSAEPSLRRKSTKDPERRASRPRSRIDVIASVVSKPFRRSFTGSDITVWTVNTDGRYVTCAKVTNAGVLTRPGPEVWTKLEGVQCLEIEDREGMLQILPKQFCGELYNLEALSATWTNIRALPPRLFQLPLKTLDLQRNKLKSLDGLDQALYIGTLDVSNNFLEVLPDNLGQLVSLESLNVAGNRIADLPDSIGSLRRLTTFNCSNNRLQSLPSSLCDVTELTSLDVSNNQLTILPVNIGDLVKLKDFRAQCNSLRSLPKSFEKLQRLTSLLLRNNNFDYVPPQLASLTNLQTLNMSNNHLGSMDIGIPSLTFLVLDQNDFNDIDVGIFLCANLGLLSMQRNRIDQITGNFSQLTNLRSLFLSHNAIADVPDELSHLTHLLHLDLSSTNIKTIPLDVASLPNLQTLKLEDCTEMEPKLKDSYHDRGRVGVIEYLRKHPNSKKINAKPPMTKTSKASSPIATRPNERKNTLRAVAVQSIVPAAGQALPSSTSSDSAESNPAKLYSNATEITAESTELSASSSSINQSSNSRPAIAKKPNKTNL